MDLMIETGNIYSRITVLVQYKLNVDSMENVNNDIYIYSEKIKFMCYYSCGVICQLNCSSHCSLFNMLKIHKLMAQYDLTNI